MPTSHERCPCCSTPVSSKTLAKFGGVCRRCAKQPISFRKQWIFWGVMTILTLIAAVLMDQELAALEAAGGGRVHWLVAIAYGIAGRTGVLILFGLSSSLSAFLCYKTYRSAQLAKVRNAAAIGSD